MGVNQKLTNHWIDLNNIVDTNITSDSLWWDIVNCQEVLRNWSSGLKFVMNLNYHAKHK